MYQKCPVCNGDGKKQSPEYYLSSESKECNVCKGTGIISQITGLPPDFEKNKIEREKQEAAARKNINPFNNPFQFP